jgi:hypothetical protein
MSYKAVWIENKTVRNKKNSWKSCRANENAMFKVNKKCLG